jgi:hypothetical protein
MGRKKNTGNSENTENPELKTASEVLSKAEIKPEVKPEVKPEEKPEVNVSPSMDVDSGVVIETRPIAPGELEMARAEERRARKETLVKQVIMNVFDDLYNWLNTRSEAMLERYTTADPIDILIDRLTEATDDLYRRLMRFRVVTDRIGRIIGGGGGRAFSQRDLEQMIYERLAGSIAGSMEQSIEAQRRRRVAEDLVNQLMSGENQNKGEGGK